MSKILVGIICPPIPAPLIGVGLTQTRVLWTDVSDSSLQPSTAPVTYQPIIGGTSPHVPKRSGGPEVSKKSRPCPPRAEERKKAISKIEK
jgi:hypothetical protein